MAPIVLNRIRERRSNVAGYRPGMRGSRPLDPGEPFVNIPDKVRCIGTIGGQYITTDLRWTEDVVSDVLGRTIQYGSSVGRVPKLENLDGSGYPVLNTQDRLYFKRRNVTPGRFASFVFTGDQEQLVGGPAGVDHTVLVTQTIDKPVTTYQWNFGAHLFVENAYTIEPSTGNKIYSNNPNTGAGAGPSGQHCAGNMQVFVRANAPVFGLNTNIVDYVDQPVAGRVGYEAGMGITGLDPNRMRIVVAVNIGSAAYNDATQQGYDGDNRVHMGVQIAPTNGDKFKAQFTNALFIAGRTKIGINLTKIDTSWCDRQVIAMPNDGDIVWTTETEYQATPTPSARIGYNPVPSIRTLKIVGIRKASDGGTVFTDAVTDHLILDTGNGIVAIPTKGVTSIA